MVEGLIVRKLSIRAFSIFLVGLTVVVTSYPAQQFGPRPPQAVNLGLPNAPVGYLGVLTQEVNADRAKELKLPAVRGVFVSDVIANSPAAKTGIKKGDVITEYNGQVVEGMLQLGRLVRETPPGHTARVSVRRDGHVQKFSIELGKVPGP